MSSNLIRFQTEGPKVGRTLWFSLSEIWIRFFSPRETDLEGFVIVVFKKGVERLPGCLGRTLVEDTGLVDDSTFPGILSQSPSKGETHLHKQSRGGLPPFVRLLPVFCGLVPRSLDIVCRESCPLETDWFRLGSRVEW